MASALELTSTDQTLLATAISEVARNITAYAVRGEVVLSVIEDDGGRRGIRRRAATIRDRERRAGAAGRPRAARAPDSAPGARLVDSSRSTAARAQPGSRCHAGAGRRSVTGQWPLVLERGVAGQGSGGKRSGGVRRLRARRAGRGDRRSRPRRRRRRRRRGGGRGPARARRRPAAGAARALPRGAAAHARRGDDARVVRPRAAHDGVDRVGNVEARFVRAEDAATRGTPRRSCSAAWSATTCRRCGWGRSRSSRATRWCSPPTAWRRLLGLARVRRRRPGAGRARARAPRQGHRRRARRRRAYLHPPRRRSSNRTAGWSWRSGTSVFTPCLGCPHREGPATPLGEACRPGRFPAMNSPEPRCTPDRWSAQHRKTAILGWILFVVLATFVRLERRQETLAVLRDGQRRVQAG